MVSRKVSRGTSVRTIRQQGRKFVWARRRITAAAVGANASVFSDLLADFQTALGSDIVGTTVMRIRGALATNADIAVFGVRVMTQSTFAALGSANGPGSDQYADWMMYLPTVNRFDANGANTRWDIDVRSSRKLEEIGQGLLLAVENGTAQADMTFDMDLSIGLKLP